MTLQAGLTQFHYPLKLNEKKYYIKLAKIFGASSFLKSLILHICTFVVPCIRKNWICYATPVRWYIYCNGERGPPVQLKINFESYSMNNPLDQPFLVRKFISKHAPAALPKVRCITVWLLSGSIFAAFILQVRCDSKPGY